MPHVSLQQTGAGDSRTMSFCGQACSLLSRLSWVHAERPGLLVIPKSRPRRDGHAQELTCKEGASVGVPVGEPVPAWTSNPSRRDLAPGTKCPRTSTFSSAKSCAHLVHPL